MRYSAGEFHSKHLLIAGVSTRAAADSAVAAGFRVTAIDAFVDADHHPAVHALSPSGGFSARAAAGASGGIDCDGVVYLAGFENHPDAVAMLTASRSLWGNTPKVLKRVRDPFVLARECCRMGLAVPEVGGGSSDELALRTRGASSPDPGRRSGGRPLRWLLKPLAAGGGHGVRFWDPASEIPQGHYLQEWIDGTPGSVVFLAARGAVTSLAVSRQLIGESAFGATGFQYCGSIFSPVWEENPSDPTDLVVRARNLASSLAREFDLLGVNGIDFVERGGVPYLVEVNPRWCGSVELVERACGLSVLGAHVAACTTGSLPDPEWLYPQGEGEVWGKAIVFARRDLSVGETRPWSDEAQRNRLKASIRDVPRPGTVILSGRPVCTVFATAVDQQSCHDSLVRRARSVYSVMDQWERPVSPS